MTNSEAEKSHSLVNFFVFDTSRNFPEDEVRKIICYHNLIANVFTLVGIQKCCLLLSKGDFKGYSNERNWQDSCNFKI